MLVEDWVDDDAGCDEELAEDELTKLSDEEPDAEAVDDCTDCIELSPILDELSPVLDELSPVLDELPPFDDTSVLEATDESEKEPSELL